MKRIAYLLHRFPGTTDTFIKREIRCLQKLGTDVQVISYGNRRRPKAHWKFYLSGRMTQSSRYRDR